jgi:uncharacterized protein YciI
MKNYFFLKLVPCRPTFALDMSDAERAIMGQHVAYWKTHLDKGDVVVFGPVMDPAGPYGMGVVAAESEAQIREFIANDPASQINTYEFYPMRAVLPS